MGARLEGVEGAKRAIREDADRMLEAYLGQLDSMAMKVVSAIRDGKNPGDTSYWWDHSGNLRSSIGYIILYDGRRVHENFKVVNGRGEEGMQKAKSFADELQKKYPSGIVLIIMAGMEYAAYVEDVESRTVLKGGESLAKSLLAEINAKWEAKYGK